MTTISVSYQRNRWVEGGGSDQYSVGITFETAINADCERELMTRIQQAQAFVEEAALRRAVPESDLLKRFRAKLPTFTTREQLEASSAYCSKLFAEGKIERRELNMMDEEIADALCLLECEQVTLPAGDACDPPPTIVEKLKAQLSLMTGNEVETKT